VAGGFCLGKFQGQLQIGDTHFALSVQQVKNAQPRLVGKRFKDLGPELKAEIFKPHATL
jgi:hypothetical protein